MLNFLKSGKCKAVLWVLALLIGLMLYAVFVGGYTISSVGVFKAIAAPFQKLSNSISQHVEYGLDLYRNAEDYSEENKALRKEINLLHTELADYEATKEELERLQAFVGIKEKHEDYSMTSPFDVTGYVTNDPFCAFMIDGGSDDGISLYDPVVSDMGLVGVITELGTHTATVTTILSPELSVAAGTRASKERGILTGSVSLAMEGLCKLQYLEKDVVLKKDKIILTTGENGLFPAGYVIGYVRETGMDDTGLTGYAAVEPASDLKNLSLVVVITDFSGKADSDDVRE
ncbi:MAG: rod shape-determining protein MreC [Oscillospiraceae bacterium]|nr:rod shape-determining protein MreC [Oscillospiraceae bacterium]